MIGVVADSAERDVVCEFFELFKTPWEFCQKGRRYDVVLWNGNGQPPAKAKLTIVYSGKETDFDGGTKPLSENGRKRVLLHQDIQIPIYGECLVFPEQESVLLIDHLSRQA